MIAETDSALTRRLARRVDDILTAARDRERRGQTLALDIDARFRLEDSGAVQFQLASAILEETTGMCPEEVVSELLSLGLAAVLDSAEQVTREDIQPEFLQGACLREALDSVRTPSMPAFPGSRVLN